MEQMQQEQTTEVGEDQARRMQIKIPFKYVKRTDFKTNKLNCHLHNLQSFRQFINPVFSASKK